MIPYRSGYRISYFKELDSRVRQHNTDIDRLMRQMQQITLQGEAIGGPVPIGGLPPVPLYLVEYEGETASAVTPVTNGKTGANTFTATWWGTVVTPATTTTPAVLGTVTGSIVIVNRSNFSAGTGKYCRWKWMQLPDGSWELRATWVDCQ